MELWNQFVLFHAYLRKVLFHRHSGIGGVLWRNRSSNRDVGASDRSHSLAYNGTLYRYGLDTT